MDWLPLVRDFSPHTIVGFVVLMIVMGWLLPIRVVKGRLADKDAVIATQAVALEHAASALSGSNAENLALRRALRLAEINNAHLLRGNGTTLHVLDALPEALAQVASAANSAPAPPVPAESGGLGDPVV